MSSWNFRKGEWQPATKIAQLRGWAIGHVRQALHLLGYDLRHLSQPSWVYDSLQAQLRLLQHIEHPVILDVGANVGQTLERYARILPNARIHSIEPFPDSFQRLRETAIAMPSAMAYQMALGEEDGEADFHVNQVYHTRNSLLTRPDSGRRYYREGSELPDTVRVNVVTLDEFCARAGIDRVHLLKLDVQGAELQVLRGGRRLLGTNAVDLIFTEVMFVPHYEHGPLFDDIHAALSNHGYSLYGLYDLILASNGQLRYANALYLSAGVRAAVLNEFPPEP